MNRLNIAGLALALMVGGPGLADSHGHKKHSHGIMKKMGQTMEGLTVKGGWARASTPGAKNAAAYVTIMNHGIKSDALIGVVSDVSAKVELHSHKNDSGVMRMRQIVSVPVPAHTVAELKPGGDHIMLMGLKRPLKAGDHIMLRLSFQSGATETLKFMVMKKGGAMKKKHTH